MAPQAEATKGGKCTDGKNHKYNDQNVCEKCGFENKARAYWKQGRTRNEMAPKRGVGGAGSVRVKQSIALMISGTQSILVGFNPELEEDALSVEEIKALADVMGDEINESPTLKRWVNAAGKQSTHIRLVVVIVMIIAPRLARRGLIPAGADDVAAAVSMAAGGTSDDNRGDELGEEYAGGGGPSAEAQIPIGNTNEDGPLPPPDPVPSRNGHEVRADLGKSEIRPRRAKTKVRGSGA